MTFLSWVTLAGICLLGAMSPGPSLAVILQNRVQRDLRAALIAGWSHAAGIFFWALAAGSTLGILFQRFPPIKMFLTLAGALFLSYLAVKSWGRKSDENGKYNNQLPPAWVAGLSISILNPKIFVFFTALFSQFIPAGASLMTYLGMATVAGLVDGTWYSAVSFFVGRTGLAYGLKHHGVLLNRITACFYLFIAGLTVWQTMVPHV